MFFSIICVYNNKKKLEDILMSSLISQDEKDYELILIDNSTGEYPNAGTALNFGLKKAIGDYIIILHQDVKFIRNESLKMLKEYISSHSEFGIAGLAGIDDQSTIYANFYHGYPPTKAGKSFDVIKEVESVDECFFIIPNNIKQRVNIWEYSWHLYATEYCIRMKIEEKKVIVLPLNIIYHLSPGYSLDKYFYKSMIHLSLKYNKKIAYIYSTIRGKWSTNFGKVTIKSLKCLLSSTINEKLKVK